MKLGAVLGRAVNGGEPSFPNPDRSWERGPSGSRTAWHPCMFPLKPHTPFLGWELKLDPSFQSSKSPVLPDKVPRPRGFQREKQSSKTKQECWVRRSCRSLNGDRPAELQAQPRSTVGKIGGDGRAGAKARTTGDPAYAPPLRHPAGVCWRGVVVPSRETQTPTTRAASQGAASRPPCGSQAVSGAPARVPWCFPPSFEKARSKAPSPSSLALATPPSLNTPISPALLTCPSFPGI